jgi:hypothetical protein
MPLMRIQSVFIEYKGNPSRFRGLPEHLVQVREVKLFPFLVSNLLSVLSHECAQALLKCARALFQMHSNPFALQNTEFSFEA